MATTLRIRDENLESDIKKLAREKGKSENVFIEDAIRFYRDYLYMKDRGTIINEEILRVNKAGLDLLEQQIETKIDSRFFEIGNKLNKIKEILLKGEKVNGKID